MFPRDLVRKYVIDVRKNLLQVKKYRYRIIIFEKLLSQKIKKHLIQNACCLLGEDTGRTAIEKYIFCQITSFMAYGF